MLAPDWLDSRFNNANGVAQHKRALQFLDRQTSGGWALSVGCGCNTRFNPLLREQGLSLEGVDISERMLVLARNADPEVLLHHADICTWRTDRTYRFMSAWDSIWHVQLEQQRALMLKLLASLDRGGVLVFTAGGFDGPSEHIDSTMGTEVYYSTLGIPAILEVIQESGCALRHLEFDQWPQRHLVVVVQRAA
ncbi:class I SAM-dependent DNA methyltransferase [Ahniella affigens]|nr:methyltransferase domain-containing protein [Ahniella affigens]